MAVPYHTHEFEIPTATPEEVAASTSQDKIVTPSSLAGNIMQPVLYDPTGQGVNVYDQKNRNDSPVYYGAVGDGTTNDAADVADAEAAVNLVFLPGGSTFNLDTSMPIKPVTGAGALKVSGVTLDGYSLGYYVPIDSFSYNPSATYLANGRNLPIIYPPNPAGGNYRQYHNAIMTMGSNFEFTGPDDTNPYIIRSTMFGTFNGVQIKSWNRVDAFGHCALMFGEWVERSAALGSDAMPWGGISSRQMAIDTSHNFYRNALPNTPEWSTLPNSPGVAMEALYPGIGQRIWDYATYSSSSDTFVFNTGVGRDAMANIVYGSNNTFTGYQSGANLYAGGGNTIAGVTALQNGPFNNNITAMGYRAARDLNDSLNSVFIGKDAGLNVKKASASVFIGHNSGNGLVGDQDGVLVIANQSISLQNPLISGAFYDASTRLIQGVGINVKPKDIKNVSLHIQYGSALTGLLDPLAGAAGLLITRGADTGMTIATPNTNKGAIFFSDPESENIGGMMYDHALDRLYLRASGVYRMAVGASGYWFKDAMKTTAPAAGSKEFWVDGSGFVKWVV
jgi:hypothetical protein